MTTSRILLVDDSRTTRLILQACFVGENVTFEEAANGRMGLAAVRSSPPALVISDVFMPELDGWAFVRALRTDARPEVRRVPVILASSKRLPDIERRSLDAGADVFLPKPLAGEQLVVAVRKLLGRPDGP
jgi:CheY-like chemotaxis protein